MSMEKKKKKKKKHRPVTNHGAHPTLLWVRRNGNQSLCHTCIEPANGVARVKAYGLRQEVPNTLAPGVHAGGRATVTWAKDLWPEG